MKFPIVIASLLGVFLAPALADHGEKTVTLHGIREVCPEMSINTENNGVERNINMIDLTTKEEYCRSILTIQKNTSMENNFNGQPSENSISGIRVSTNPKNRSEAWKTIWDFKAGYVATKVFSKNTCIIATTSKRFWLGKPSPTPPPGDKVLGPYQLPPRENRFVISRKRLQSLSPYGKRIQALCRGIPSYLAYPAPGSNFLRGSNFSSG